MLIDIIMLLQYFVAKFCLGALLSTTLFVFVLGHHLENGVRKGVGDHLLGIVVIALLHTMVFQIDPLDISRPAISNIQNGLLVILTKRQSL